MILATLLCACAPVRLCAQVVDTVPKKTPALVHYGKWLALGGAVAFGVAAKQNNDKAEAAYDELSAHCIELPVACLTGPDGSYLDPVAESLYDETTRYDHRAGRYLLAAEVTFAAAVAGFVWEIVNHKDHTPTIPFEPRVEAGLTTTKVGVTFRF